MIVLIDHNNSIVCITCNTGRKIKLTISSSFYAKLELVRSIREKHLDSIVAAIGNDDLIIFVDANAPRAWNVAIFMTIEAECETLKKDFLFYFDHNF